MHWLILEQLADGELHSGETIARRLGVSRTAVWKAFNKLEQFDLLVEHQRGVGYRLAGAALDLLDAHQIRQAMPGISVGKGENLSALRLFKEIPSTNQYLLDEEIGHAAGPVACLAEYQHAGRGRRGRNWYSPFGANLYCSLAWPVRSSAADLSGLSLAVGVTVAELLSAMQVPGIGLKWPNDLLVDGQKLGGILIDLRGEANGVIWAVVGVGINVNMQAGDGQTIDQPWTSCQQLIAKPLSRNQLAGQLIDRLISAMTCFEQQGFAAFSQRWHQLDLLVGKPVWVEQGGEKMAALAAGVDASGALRVSSNGSSFVLHSGEVSVRAAD
ncbi:MAG: biotin--[acetyl-CoA-carboxylase] ligase [Gammaproteobacteria bacterium]